MSSFEEIVGVQGNLPPFTFSRDDGWDLDWIMQGCAIIGGNADGSPLLTIDSELKVARVRLVGRQLVGPAVAMQHVRDGNVDKYIVPMEWSGD